MVFKFTFSFLTPLLLFSFSSAIFEKKKIKKIHIGSSCRLPQLTAAIELVSEISRQLNERKTEAVAEITSTFEELERALHQRKTALITDLENICSTKQKVSCVIAVPALMKGHSHLLHVHCQMHMHAQVVG